MDKRVLLFGVLERMSDAYKAETVITVDGGVGEFSEAEEIVADVLGTEDFGIETITCQESSPETAIMGVEGRWHTEIEVVHWGDI